MSQLFSIFEPRPFWMNAIMVFCAYMTFIYMPFDMFIKPVAEDQEVWFGIMLTGWAAKATEPLHWLIYGFGFYGFLKMKAWLIPWAPLYVLQVAIGMFVWSILDERGPGVLVGAGVALPFVALAIALYMARDKFGEPAEPPTLKEAQETEDGAAG